MELTLIVLVYVLVILIPINFLCLMAIRRERQQMRITLRGFWRLYDRRK